MEKVSGIRYGDSFVSTLNGTLREIEVCPKTDDSPMSNRIGIAQFGGALASFVVKKGDVGVSALKKATGKSVYSIFIARRTGNFLYAFLLDPHPEVINQLNEAIRKGVISDVMLEDKQPAYMSKKRLFGQDVSQ